jgi:hypothetical protein
LYAKQARLAIGVLAYVKALHTNVNIFFPVPEAVRAYQKFASFTP